MPESLDLQGLKRWLDRGAQLVEVLPRKGYEEAHLPGAVNIPLKELDERAPRELERERPVIVYCNDYQ